MLHRIKKIVGDIKQKNSCLKDGFLNIQFETFEVGTVDSCCKALTLFLGGLLLSISDLDLLKQQCDRSSSCLLWTARHFSQRPSEFGNIKNMESLITDSTALLHTAK